MPIYTFQCKCGNTFDSPAKIGQESTTCHKCTKKAKKIFSIFSPAVIYKGDGFYSKDKRVLESWKKHKQLNSDA